MTIRMDRSLRFWIDCAVDRERDRYPKVRRQKLLARTLERWEKIGEAMRYRDINGKIAWRASPAMLERLADAEAEARADLLHEIDTRAVMNDDRSEL